jgi:hypothetical protein
MTKHIGYIHGTKLESFSPPTFCRSEAGLQEYLYYYQLPEGISPGHGQPVPAGARPAADSCLKPLTSERNGRKQDND